MIDDSANCKLTARKKCKEITMKTIYISLFVMLCEGNTHLSAQCTASFSGAYPTCCPNTWQFTDTSHISAGDSIISWYWNLPGGTPSFSTVQNPFTTYPALGFYNVCLTIVTFNGCTDSSCQTINVTGLQVGENDNPPAFLISPNPLSTQAVIELTMPLLNASLSIYNLYGQCVAIIEHLTEQKIILQREHFPCGIYFFRATDGRVILTEKLIVE